MADKIFGTPFKKEQVPWNKGRLGKATFLYGSRFYQCWYNMKTRCYNYKYKSYNRYGGRGITVCNKWLDFKGFYEDMYLNYKDDLTLDRIDNNKGYCKENCRWVDRIVQANNTRQIKLITYKGKSQTLPQWARELGIKRSTLSMRYYSYKWEIDRVFSQKIGGKSYR